MDRVARSLDQEDNGSFGSDEPFMLSRHGNEDSLVTRQAAGIPEELLRLGQLEVEYEQDGAILWTFMRAKGRPAFNPAMLRDFVQWQDLIAANFGPGKVPLRYLVLGSRSPDVFCYGGDLELFQRLIREQDRQGLVAYGHRCCDILHRNLNSLGLPILTLGLVQGAALGGGFEALLSFDYVVAERDATFGLPEILFGLFPGMGAHSLLSRKIGTAMADRLIVSSKTYSAEEMFELGLVHELAEPGMGLEACRNFIAKTRRRHPGMVNARKAMKLARGVSIEELKRVTELWADTALQLREHDLKVMNRLIAAQAKVAERAG